MKKLLSGISGLGILFAMIMLSVIAVRRQDEAMNSKFRIITDGKSYIVNGYQKSNGYLIFSDENNHYVEVSERFEKEQNKSQLGKVGYIKLYQSIIK